VSPMESIALINETGLVSTTLKRAISIGLLGKGVGAAQGTWSNQLKRRESSLRCSTPQVTEVEHSKLNFTHKSSKACVLLDESQ